MTFSRRSSWRLAPDIRTYVAEAIRPGAAFDPRASWALNQPTGWIHCVSGTMTGWG